MIYFLVSVGAVLVLSLFGMLPGIISTVKRPVISTDGQKRLDELEKKLHELEQLHHEGDQRIKQLETNNEFLNRLLEDKSGRR
ncbi:MAG: hypothetical protein A2087_00490 [Spirochaetes bacterium GWD1_61_31]|nr:MAG: hypothetical protein A2Y37_00455 [Spirochaetes bacterium GWB1_60_80]OHD28938.1 MAG: hypothetical protein A2004_10935 [Spirochaetes bacterium GWC1_61_12]OHD39126.1 MAG: hypothetical protein A2087_00490 [Spirochaetes bacterium GWD1_61_31]OHD43527.1 MAG: hypothetical protein A2Y35_04605 [Spirochaetes bacterium GWE1_60_18]OHD58994.1 MAG: hypothetical protein A2Y32_01800 [Spirochaetes bacterium GWF1_60_12]HAP44489.1 hypothetical protein [Spirochaetaceae bacterium]